MRVRATSTAAIRTFPGLTVITEGTELDSNDPIVKAQPWLFAADNVERATANPGEKRSTRRVK